MPHPRTFRFGLQAHNATSGQEWSDLARTAESLGYSTLFLPDHFGEQLAPVPALAHAAAVTEELRVGALVFDNDYRHPLVLAKEIATMDLLSDGRVELGLGAGWMRSDYDESGIPLDPAGVRVDRMVEAIRVMKGLFGGEPVTHEGEHYRITSHTATPAPVQRPHPPLLIGGGGPRVLGIAAREADIVGVNPNMKAGEIGPDAIADAMAGPVDRKVARVREAAGDRFDELELNLLVFGVQVTDDRVGTATGLAQMFGAEVDDVLATPHFWLGTVDEIVESLRAARERWGFSYFCVQEDALHTAAPIVERLAGT